VDGRPVRIAQANNAFVFPGLGLGTLVAEAREVTDGMLLAAAERLAEETAARAAGDEALFPAMRDLRAVSVRVAEAVVREARAAGVGSDIADGAIPGAVANAMWEPVYPKLETY
jgi:malate dehydrogenase (oxaloacetate-decarboxylating)